MAHKKGYVPQGSWPRWGKIFHLPRAIRWEYRQASMHHMSHGSRLDELLVSRIFGLFLHTEEHGACVRSRTRVTYLRFRGSPPGGSTQTAIQEVIVLVEASSGDETIDSVFVVVHWRKSIAHAIVKFCHRSFRHCVNEITMTFDDSTRAQMEALGDRTLSRRLVIKALDGFGHSTDNKLRASEQTLSWNHNVRLRFIVWVWLLKLWNAIRVLPDVGLETFFVWRIHVAMKPKRTRGRVSKCNS